MSYKLLTDNQAKINKAFEFGYYNVILHLSPAKTSGRQVCPNASPECIKLCLNDSGHAEIVKKGETTNKVKEARKRRTLFYFNDRKGFIATLTADINKAIKKAEKLGLKLAVRLNGTSDILTLAVTMAKLFPNVQFYDYTKNLKKVNSMFIPSNLHYTISRSELNENEALALINRFNVAIVFKAKELPKKYKGYNVIDGDKNDLRFTDKKGVIVGLKVKGKRANRTESPFFVTL